MSIKVLSSLLGIALLFWAGIYSINGWRGVLAVLGISVLSMVVIVWSETR